MNNRILFDADDLKLHPRAAHRALPADGRALAAGEAEALAWINGFPSLLLLLEEKVQAEQRYTPDQACLRSSATSTVARNGSCF